jgi:hypothetical protein
MALFGVKQIKTTAYHPKSNGMVERFNRTLKRMLKQWVNDQHTNWDVLLPFALFAYNTSVHSVLKETPFYLNYARQPRTITDVLTDNDLIQRKTVHAYAHEVVERLKTVHEQVIDILKSVNAKRQQDIDDEDEVKHDVFTVGDSVFLHQDKTPVHRSRKLIKRWIGPFIITKTHNNNTSTILKHGGESLVSNDRLRKVRADETSADDMHQRDIELATEELTAINDSIKALLERQSALTEIAEIAKFARNNEAKQENDVQHDEIDREEQKYDDEHEEDVEDIIVNGMFCEAPFAASF